MQVLYLVWIKKISIAFFILLLCIILVSIIAGLGLFFDSKNYIWELPSILWGSRLSILMLLVFSFMIALFTQMFMSEVRKKSGDET
jgi:hypothetical protein